MATAVASKGSKAAQASINARAASKARKIVEQKTKEMRERFRKAAPALRKDVVEAYALPAVAGVAAAHALDFTVGSMPWAQGAKGDLMKGAAAIGVGIFGRKFVKSSYLQPAAVGAATVNLYKFTSRLLNRTATGTVAGVLSGTDDSDLVNVRSPQSIGAVPALQSVEITLRDGRKLLGYQDAMGNLFDAGRSPLLGEMPALPFEVPALAGSDDPTRIG